MISSNAHIYPVSALCQCLGIARSLYYYHKQRINHPKDQGLEDQIREIFEQNRRVYGCRKIKAVLARKGKKISKRRICRIMKRLGLVAAYSRKKPKTLKTPGNQAETANLLNRKFNDQPPYATVVSDLTYVRVGSQWHYLCILLDLHNREIIGHSVGPHKDAQLVRAAFASVSVPLTRLQIFHTDRGNEFDNQLIDEVLEVFQIRRSLSAKACPYDNAVAEATFKLIKAEFVWNHRFSSLDQLRLAFSDYVHWFNHFRLHSSLDYLSPIQFRLRTSFLLSH